MKAFSLNIILTFVWVSLTGVFDITNFLIGFGINYMVIWLSTGLDDTTGYFKKIPLILNFGFYFMWEIIKANYQLTYDILTPTHKMNPAIIGIPMDAKSDIEIALLANLITLTPGTLTIDVSTDKKTIYVHTMYLKDKQSFIDEIKLGLEQKILQIVR